MPTHPVTVSPATRSRAEHSGEPGRRWLTELPDLVAAYEAQWTITVTDPLTGAGEGYVARAKREDGTPAVFKLNLLLDYRRSQIDVLEQARGNAYAEVYAAAHDPDAFTRGLCSQLATATGVDPQAIWEWGFLERVATVLWVLEFGQAWGLEKLANAEHLIGTD